MNIRKGIKTFIKTNGASTKAVIVADCVSQGARQQAVDRIIDVMTKRGKLIKIDDDYNLSA